MSRAMVEVWERSGATLPIRMRFIVVAVGAIPGISGCVVDEIPPCPGQCFEYTVEYDRPLKCLTADTGDIDIPFTGSDPAGYRGRHCFNSSSVELVFQAIDHLRGGGLLSELPLPVRDAYVDTVDAVRENLRAQCVLAAPGQCMNAEEVCAGIAGDLYAQLVTEQTCVLTPDGIEPVMLSPGQICEAIDLDPDTESSTDHDPCTDVTTGIDETATGLTDGADETTAGTTGMLGPEGLRPR